MLSEVEYKSIEMFDKELMRIIPTCSFEEEDEVVTFKKGPLTIILYQYEDTPEYVVYLNSKRLESDSDEIRNLLYDIWTSYENNQLESWKNEILLILKEL